MNYCDRLYFCNLEPLEIRRLHNNVIIVGILIPIYRLPARLRDRDLCVCVGM